MDFQLSRYPENEQSERNDVTISIINFDNYFREKIGHPFLVLTKKFYPISAIRQYIEEKLGLKEHCHLKLVISNKIDICELCGKYRCPQSSSFNIQIVSSRTKTITPLNGLMTKLNSC